MSSKAELIRSYELGGIYSDWKNLADHKFGTLESQKVYDNLDACGIIPKKNENLVFISPSASIPTHEFAMWQKDSSTRIGKNNFLIGDISQINPVSVTQRTNFSNHYIFQYLRMDAEAMPFPDNFADIIWDRKGALWHKAYESENLEQVLELLLKYHEILKPGGSVVIDAIDGFAEHLKSLSHVDLRRMIRNRHECKLRNIPLNFSNYLPKDIPQFEESTVDLIRQIDPNFHNNNTIKSKFKIKEIGKNKLKICVFKKK